MNIRKATKRDIPSVSFITDTFDLEKLAEGFLVHCIRAFHVHSGSVFVADSQEPVLRLLKAIGPRQNRHIGKTVRFGEGVTGIAAARKKPVRLSDNLSGIQLRPRKDEGQVRQFLSFPIIDDNEVLAVINLSAADNEHVFGRSDVYKYKSISREIAGILRRMTNQDRFVFPENSEDLASRDFFRSMEINKEVHLLAHLPHLVLLFDHSLRITSCNRNQELEALFGRITILNEIGGDLLGLPLEIEREVLKEKLADLRERGIAFRLNNIRLIGSPERRVVNLYFSPIFKSDGKFCGGVLTLDDNTSNYEVQQRLLEAERLSLIGSLTSMVTHEINNPLDGVTRLVKLALTNLQQGRNAEEYLDQTLKGLGRMSSLVKSLLSLSRKNGQFEAELAPLNAVVESALAFSRCRTNEKHVDFHLQLPLEKVIVNANDFYQVFANLLSNAVDAICSDSGAVTVKAVLDGAQLHIMVTDNGCGIPATLQSRIFDAFWTTKEYGKGTGLGLAIVKKIAQRHQGTVHVESEENAGTTIHITIPVDRLAV